MTKDDRDTVRDLFGDFAGLLIEGVQGIVIGAMGIVVLIAVALVEIPYSLTDRADRRRS